MVIPPAVEVKAIAPLSVPWVFVTTIVSDVPTFVVSWIAEAESSLDEIRTWPPAISTFLLAAASISTPPAVAVTAIAASSVPLVLTILTSSLPAVSEAATLK